jgi:hypothetical protein
MLIWSLKYIYFTKLGVEMEKIKFKKFSVVIFSLISILWLFGCSEHKNNIVESQISPDDQQSFEKIADNDESIASFEPNYNEQQAMELALGKITTSIYPIKVGQKMIRISKNLEMQVNGDTAIGILTKTFNGTLYIAASYNPEKTRVDSIFQKTFTTIITSKIIFVKFANTRRMIDNWKIAAISLPEGGTETGNIEITRLTVNLSSGEMLEVTSPNDYFLFRNQNFMHQGRWKIFPMLEKGDSATLRLEVKSMYPDTDFVTLTYGADHSGFNRSKKKFDLVSQTFDGLFYNKVYERSYKTHQWGGYFNAVINAIPRQVIYDNTTPVEIKTWGLPYFVR